MKFDVVVGNPPYQAPKEESHSGRGKCGASLWEGFVNKSIAITNVDGHISLVHPSRWRKPNSKLGDLFYSKNLKYLEIHGINDGIKTFGCTTRYDWYLLQNSLYQGKTIIKDEDGFESVVNLETLLFIPNGKINEISNLIAKGNESRVEILYSRSDYGTDKKNMKKEMSDVYKYPCVYSINSKGKTTFWYSSIKSSHFGIPKVIFPSGDFKSVDVLIDINGEYALTQFARGIVDVPKNLPMIAKALRSKKFIDIYSKITMGTTELDKEVLKHFRKDFWKEFI